MTPLVFLSTETCTVTIGEQLKKTVLSGTPTTLQMLPLGSSARISITTLSEARSVNIVHVKIPDSFDMETFTARSCDSVTFPGRDSMIGKLAEHAPNTLVHLGDSIYADGYINVAASPEEVREQYVRAWVKTFVALVPTTSNCFNLLLPDDHEIWDNFDRDNLLAHEQVGMEFLKSLYAEWMGPFRQMKHPDPYDNYTFSMNNASFAVLGRGLAESADYLRAESDGRELVVFTPKANVETSLSWLLNVWYTLKCKTPTFNLAEDAWLVLEKRKSVTTLVAGDLHSSIESSDYRGVHLVISSAFSSVQPGRPGVVSRLAGRLDDRPNFVTLTRESVGGYTAKFTYGQPTGWIAWLRTIWRQFSVLL
jgi:hypothetical protein